MKDTQTQINEAVADLARERVDAIKRTMAALGLDDSDDCAYDALDELYSGAWYAGQGWESSYPS